MPQSLEEMAKALARCPYGTGPDLLLSQKEYEQQILAALSAARAQGLRDAAEAVRDEYGSAYGDESNAERAIRALLDSPSAAPERPADREVVTALATLFWCIWCEDKRGAVAMSEAGLIRQVDAAEYALTDLGRAALAIAEKQP